MTESLQSTGHASAQPDETPELSVITQQRNRFVFVSMAAIVVSFVHMAAALVLFSEATWYERGAALGMTALVDLATWAVAEYLDYAARRELTRSPWTKVLFGFALVISMFLNGAYLWANRPPDKDLPEVMSAGIAIAFAVFTPLLIAVASLIRGELTNDRMTLLQTAQVEQTARHHLAMVESELRTTRAQLAQLERERAQLSDHAATDAHERAQLRAQLAHLENERAQLEQERAHLADRAAQAGERSAQEHAQRAQLERTAAQAQQETAQLRAQLAQLQSELADARATEPIDLVSLAQGLIERGISQRETAQLVGLKESTLRNRLKALSNGHLNGVA